MAISKIGHIKMDHVKMGHRKISHENKIIYDIMAVDVFALIYLSSNNVHAPYG